MANTSLKKGDNITVLTGKDAGKTGKIISVDRKTGKITVEGINVHHRFEKAKANKPGQKVSFPGQMFAGKVMLVCPSCGKPTRIGNKILENGKKQRVCK